MFFTHWLIRSPSKHHVCCSFSHSFRFSWHEKKYFFISEGYTSNGDISKKISEHWKGICSDMRLITVNTVLKNPAVKKKQTNCIINVEPVPYSIPTTDYLHLIWHVPVNPFPPQWQIYLTSLRPNRNEVRWPLGPPEAPLLILPVPDSNSFAETS